MTLWTRDAGGEWQAVELAVPLAIGAAGDLGPTVADPVARLVPFVDRGARAAALIQLGGSVLLNGLAPFGVAVLADRDEIVVRNARLVFTPYGLPVAESWPADAPETRCARCSTLLQVDDLCIRCPACRAPSHEQDDRRCFSYDPLTACCRRARAALRSVPEDDDADA